MEYKSKCFVENPLVSVFIFTYNQENIVHHTINSILAQKTKFPIEIIIAEDCSSDNTKTICLEYFNNNPEKVLLIANDYNKGFVKNFHESILRYSRGKYIACCAGDDWWCDEFKLQKQVDFLESHSDYDLIHTKSKIYFQKNAKLSKKTMGDNVTEFEKIIVSGRIAALTVCYTKKAFKEYIKEIDPVKVNFVAEDYPMWIWFSYRKKIYFLDEATTVYRVQNESLSNSESPFKNHYDQLDRKNIKMFFYNYFGILDKNLLNSIDLKYYIDTIRTAALVGDKENIKERNSLFLKNKLYILFVLSQLYSICGKNAQLNNFLFFVERALRKSGITQRHYL